MSFAAHPTKSVARAELQKSEFPAPVTAFIDAVNAMDHAALVDLFVAEALVNDQLRDFWGLACIDAWLLSEVVGAQLHLRVLNAIRHFDDVVVKAEVSGDFDKTGLPAPLVLHFHFSLEAEKICRLFILSNLPTDAAPEVRVPRPDL